MEAARTGLRNLMAELLRARPAEEAVLLAWPLVCGKVVAARTTASAFSAGVLTVEVPDPTWRGQLASFVPRYIREYEALLAGVVKEINLRLNKS
jgi:hypothetical protein